MTVNNGPAGEPSDAAEQVSANRSSTPDTSESTPPKERGEEPAGPSADDPAELRHRLLRALAEQQNFQRRLERERDDAVRFAAAELVKEILQTADNLSCALQSVTPGLYVSPAPISGPILRLHAMPWRR